MSDQAEKRDFITTIKELMRLTREGVLDWSVDYPSSVPSGLESSLPDRLPTYRAEYENLIFVIEDARPDLREFSSLRETERVRQILNNDNKYVLKIKDKDDNSVILSPPMKPIRDLISVIEKKPQKEKLEDINKRLSEIKN